MNPRLLLRDNLSDTGSLPSHGSWYASPDLIVHSQVADPQQYFKESYGQDVSMRLETGSMSNLIYARVKNIGTEPVEAYIRAYACLSSLFLNPSQWKQRQLSTLDGTPYVRTGLILPGEIGVGQQPFVFNAQANTGYCHTGYAMTTADDPDFPAEFKDYDSYVAWIQGSAHAAARNHSIIRTEKSSYEQLDRFSNPSQSETRIAVFAVAASAGFPAGTRIAVECPPLGISTEQRVADPQQPLQFTASGFVPAGFDGTVRTAVYLPAGGAWPAGGTVSVAAYVNLANEKSVAAPYALHLPGPPTRGLNAGKLIHLGTCSTEFVR